MVEFSIEILRLGEIEAEFTEVNLLSLAGDTIKTVNLTDIGDGEYSGSFVTPNQPFQLQIIGTTNSSGNPISRVSTTGIGVTNEELGMEFSKYLWQGLALWEEWSST